jgi:small subunit ribosomal protein S16
LLAIRLMRMGAKKQPAYRVVVKEQRSKRDGACLENVGTYNPTRNPAEVKLKLDRIRYWIERGAQPSATVERLIKSQSKAAASETASEAAA